MITGELLDFLRTQHELGTPRSELERMLQSEGGWEKADIDEAFRTLGIDLPKVEIPKAPPLAPTAPLVDIGTIRAQAISNPIPPPMRAEIPVEAPVVLKVQSLPREIPIESTVAILKEPEIKTPEIIEAPKADITIATTEDKKDVAPTMSAQEDFLGIFVDTPIPEKEERIAQLASQPLPLQAALASSAIPLEAEAPVLPEVVVPILPRAEVSKVESNASGERPRSFQEMLAQISAPPPKEPVLSEATPVAQEIRNQQPPPPAKSIHFDLSQLRKETPSREGKPIAMVPTAVPTDDTPATPPEAAPTARAKSIETKSVAELWLEKKEAPTTRPSIVGKRTMASDILLRGSGSAIHGMPAISVPDEPVYAEMAKAETPSGSQPATPPRLSPEIPPPLPVEPPRDPKVELALQLLRKQKMKKILTLSLGALLTLLLVGGGIFAFSLMRGPDIASAFSLATDQFLSVPSFAYKGKASTNVVLSTATDGVLRNGAVKFTLDYAGQLQNTKDGYGDGIHRVKLSGLLQTGDFSWATDVESDVRMFANELYFHVLSFPSATGVDPDVFKIYWIKVDMEEVARELALSGAGITKEGYGNFGGGNSSNNFTSLLSTYRPFTPGERITDDASDPSTLHLKLKTDPEQMYLFVTALYHKYTGKELTVDANQRLRFKNALAKIDAQVWVDSKTNTLKQFAFSVNFDDDIVDVHVKGPFSMNVELSNYNTPVAVSLPNPTLTLPELQSRMNDYKKVREARAADAQKVDNLLPIKNALEMYKTEVGRYPASLSELRLKGRLATTTITNTVLNQYDYASYIKPDLFTKANRCTQSGKVCTFYHIGVNFTDPTDPQLSNDSDQTTEVHGDDRAGCVGEANVACYDIVSAVAASTTPTQ